ncbi:MAG: hypothetical protein ABH836_07695 [Candidatus Omnitrophota bacterium]
MVKRNVFIKVLLFVWMFLVLTIIAATANTQGVIIGSLSSDEIQQIGQRVFENECSAKDKNLIVWNEGEDFLSLGIGHFIWHPANSKIIFEESFIKFIEYAKASGEKIPLWLDKKSIPACPWSSRDDFLNAQSDSRLMELKNFIIKTKTAQATFIVKRLEESLLLILKNIPEGTRDKISSQFSRVASSPSGIYALADYVNFKGLGISPAESYQGKGWGLLQVLEEMKSENEVPDALEEFTRSANMVLENRVKNSPASRNEIKWLKGWQNRVNSYIKK